MQVVLDESSGLLKYQTKSHSDVILANHRNAEPAKKKNLAHQLNTRSAQYRNKNAQIHQPRGIQGKCKRTCVHERIR